MYVYIWTVFLINGFFNYCPKMLWVSGVIEEVEVAPVKITPGRKFPLGGKITLGRKNPLGGKITHRKEEFSTGRKNPPKLLNKGVGFVYSTWCTGLHVSCSPTGLLIVELGSVSLQIPNFNRHKLRQGRENLNLQNIQH